MRRTRETAGLLIACLVLIIAITQAAYAMYTPKVNARTDKDGTAYLEINGADVIRLMTPNADLKPAERAQIAADRLAAMVEKGVDPATIHTKKVGQGVRIMVGESLLMIATTAEAKAHKTTPADLAAIWAANIRKYLTMPPLSVNRTSLMIPYGETRSFDVQSFLQGKIKMAASDPKVVSMDTEKKPGTVVVKGMAVGDSTITLSCLEYEVSVAVKVRKYAAHIIPGGRKATVTGYVCPGSLVARSARVAAMQSVELEPGATVTSISAPTTVEGLGSGRSTEVPILAEVAGSDYLPIKLPVHVKVENQALPKASTTSIMYSNNPERVEKYQNLFTGQLEANGKATRLLFHHQNMMEKRIGFVIDVVNPSQTPATLHVVEGVSDPMLDTVIVGYVAGREFMQNMLNGVGRVYAIPPGTRQILVSQSLGNTYTASGIMELRQLSGDPIYLRVTSKPDDLRVVDDRAEYPIPAPGVDASRLALSNDVYPDPIQDLDITYTAGKPWVFLRIGGKDSLKHATEDLTLFGNYGVTYEIKAKVENPSGSPLTAEVAFEPTAGPASAIFYVNGDPVRIRYLTPPTEYTISRVTVPAGETRTVSIRTIPLSGSAYPATLIIRPTGTVASAGG